MKVWVTRDRDRASHPEVCVWEGSEAPVVYEDGYYDCRVTERTTRVVEEFEAIEASRFKGLFGFTPRKGSCKQYELSLKEIE